MNSRNAYFFAVMLLVAACWLVVNAGSANAGQQGPGNRGPQGAPPPPPNAPPPGGPRREGGDPNRLLFALLDLSAAQKEQIEAIRDREREAARPLHDQLREVQKQLHDATANGAFDEATVRQLANRIGHIEADLTVLHLETGSEIFNVLTPEQKAKLAELREKLKPQDDERQPPPRN